MLFGAYLVTDPIWPSTFVDELLEQFDDLRQIGTPTPECPSCERGVLQVKFDEYGPFWGCTEYWSNPSCRHTEDVEIVA